MSYEYVKRFIRELLYQWEATYIRHIRYNVKDLPKPEELVYQLDQKKPVVLDRFLKSEYKPHLDVNDLPHTGYNPWTKKGNTQFRMSQNYLSPNWSNGGESNITGMVSVWLEANYNNLKNIQFDNYLQVQTGVNTSSSDTLRHMNISTDQLRIVSKLGILMHNNWYYTISSEFLTQMMNNYKKNTNILQSSFLSPAKLFVSVGMDFKKTNKKKGYDLSIFLSPLTYKLNYLYDNRNMNPASYGIDPGKHVGHEFGLKVSSTINWKFSDQINWRSKIYYYSDFSYIDSDWENTIDLMLNHNFSTQIYLHMKMDDRIQRDPGEMLLQWQELLSFGVVYRW